ncbi:small-conductance mechanosensitive channel [Agromyces flavus]|uniref:Small-conductance mechanosensitive channel n=1 Tax=Agromyces flavus TaxID=589382 RepID=A0A1H1YBH7_9MICO|nr:hypothetical protein [Agromyces flavus]MCP2366635.1 small-conductance mechanosensitive channel [Agromyces flavus]GGI45070.1 hypothetical protein GCM10010932_07780 [Agromyces flavus]SDT18629.1 hypothetical protein SAMN04489721_2710 [Agromyces flavus]
MNEAAASDAAGRPRRRPRRTDRSVDEQAEALKERVYATFTGLAIVLVQHANVEHVSATRATLTLLVGIVAITAAGFVADIVAHLAVHAAFPERDELGRMLRISGSAIASAGVPLILLALAAFGVFELEGALRAASIVYLVTLGLIGYVAVRRTRAPWWKQLLGLGALVALGLAVVVLQQLAHGH